jgi:hypothetical protein
MSENQAATHREEIKSRALERLAWGLETTCRLISGEERTLPALVRDLSSNGVGLVLDSYLQPGSELAIQIPPAHENMQAEHLHVRVVHAAALPGGQWLLGCSLTRPLSENERQRLLERTGKS